MWLWRLSRSRLNLKVRLLIGSCLVHGILIGIFFGAYGQKYHLTVTNQAIATHARVVLLPLHKRAPAQQIVSASKAMPKTTAVRGVRLASLHKKTVAVNQKKIVPKKITPKKNVAKITPPKKAERHKIAHTNKQESKKITEPPLVIAEKNIPVPIEPQPSLATAIDTQTEVVQEQVLYVGQADLDELALHEHIQHEVVRCWRPPAGLRTGITCVIVLQIDWEGKLQTSTLQQASGVLAYDVSARQAVGAMHFPRAAHGKEIIVTFRQEHSS